MLTSYKLCKLSYIVLCVPNHFLWCAVTVHAGTMVYLTFWCKVESKRYRSIKATAQY